MNARFAAIFALILSGCSPVAQQTKIASPVGETLTAGVGDVMLRAEGRESMPNAFGNADLFGRTRPTGFTTVQYGGMKGGNAVLLRSGVTIASDATTMNSTPLIVPTQSTSTAYGTIGSRQFEATSTTTGMAYIPARGSTTTSAQQPTIPIEVNWKSHPRVPVAGRMVVIEKADPLSITYRIE